MNTAILNFTKILMGTLSQTVPCYQKYFCKLAYIFLNICNFAYALIFVSPYPAAQLYNNFNGVKELFVALWFELTELVHI